jgi:hypothetical protein
MTGPELELQRQKDRAVLEHVRRHSDVSQPHRIAHHFRADSPTGGRELQAWARLNGFQVSPLQEDLGEGRHGDSFELIKSTIPTLENISPDTTLMLHLAAEFECTYQGWRCEVVP